MTTSEALRSGYDRGQLVLVRREKLEPSGPVRVGFVVALGAHLVVLNRLSDRLDLDGFELLRIGDITECLVEFRRRAVYEKALELKGCRRASPAPIRLENIEAAVDSINENYPLMVIDRERLYPEEVAIGRLRRKLKSGFKLTWMSPEAAMIPDRTSYRYSSITRVGFDGEYENTLAMVAGIAINVE